MIDIFSRHKISCFHQYNYSGLFRIILNYSREYVCHFHLRLNGIYVFVQCIDYLKYTIVIIKSQLHFDHVRLLQIRICALIPLLRIIAENFL